jgi:phosphoglycolate phosphatase-like HAD superfamily hydrolase
MADIRGVIFDVDGTLGDTVFVSVEAIVQVVRAYTGKTYSHSEIIAFFGPTEEGILRQLVPENHWQASYQTFLTAYKRIHAEHGIGAYPGISKILDLLTAHHIRQAIVTGKGAESAQISLDYFKLDGRFEQVETGSLHGSAKEVCIKKVVEGWQFQRENVLYVGDAPSDVAIAKRAGVRPISVAWADTANPEELRAQQPEALFTKVSELEDWLRTHLNHTAVKG